MRREAASTAKVHMREEFRLEPVCTPQRHLYARPLVTAEWAKVTCKRCWNLKNKLGIGEKVS